MLASLTGCKVPVGIQKTLINIEWPASTKQRVNKFCPEGLFFWLASPRNISYPIFMTPPPGAISFMVPPGSQILNSFSQFRMVLTGHTINTRVTCHIIEINKMFVLDRILRQSSSPDWRLLPNRTCRTFRSIWLNSSVCTRAHPCLGWNLFGFYLQIKKTV